MTNQTAAKKMRLVRDNEVLIASLKELHPDNLAYVLRQVAQHAPVPDSTLFLARRLDDVMNEMKRMQAENQAHLLAHMDRSLNATRESLENFWMEPGAAKSDPIKPAITVTPVYRKRVLVYGLITAQLAEIRSRLGDYVEQIDLMTEEHCSKTVKGTFDLVVMSRFINHADFKRMEAAHRCPVVVERGGLTRIVNTVLELAGVKVEA